ncbi:MULTISPECIES: TonB-dependent Fe(3+) dicitrate receptor FecA [unclassified Janthinobacterium]|uniref:TonB-dependent Fe(3+) dicitrate receptor FecA n=1 Tax=unclassified Janthinobacterium TaxID=2610881 RepID=UPI0017ED8592|nr:MULTISPECIES: TonB-dependent Fe(3+) dicitrate receptor FecA [unclassified Janthinobacterium]MBB5366602.1 Fe(3+) dicitrate transport protein [Janthinobacterium sp. K2C7]MBB5380920.1 Fe(3+) dicitrate transport protein [Janthinobacterium sp. K2Li3]MBB5384984.1 Fe(3+) dicitrate transport protein [Janthinobacterium sp. K2E3]
MHFVPSRIASPRRLAAAVQAALLMLPASMALAAPASNTPATQVAARAYQIPAGPLSTSLSRFAGEAGISLSVNGSLTDGKTAQALQGSYTPEQGLQHLLAGSGLEALVRAPGSYVLRQAMMATAPAEQSMAVVTVVGNWLAQPDAQSVFEHGGARNVVARDEFVRLGATDARDVLNRIPGVLAPANNGTGSHDMALNFGVRGLNPRLAARSTVLMDGIPVPFAPYGQPQLSFAPISMGNMDAVDVVRGGGAVRYGPQNVGGIVNFVTRAIPDKATGEVSVQGEQSPSSSSDSIKTHTSALLGGTLDNGLGGAILYSGVRGADWREHSDTKIDDVILKGRYRIDGASTLTAMLQNYEGRADMPGGLTAAAYARDPYQSTRPYDNFWGRRNLASLAYEYKPDRQRQFTVQTFYTDTLRSGYLDQGKNLTLSPRSYTVRGIETRYSQAFRAGATRHEIGVGHRYIDETSHELRYWRLKSGGILPTQASPIDRDTSGSTRANAFFIDDRIDAGSWTITPGLRNERIRSHQDNNLTGKRDGGDYNVLLPALNVIYHLSEQWNLYASSDSSFGTVQYSKMANAVVSGGAEPEKARSWELGTRYQQGGLRLDADLFLIRFSNQYESNQQTNSVYARGKTRHRGLEGSAQYAFGEVWPGLRGVNVYASYAYVDAAIKEEGDNFGKQVPFSPRHKGTAGVAYQAGKWSASFDGMFEGGQYADSANTLLESAAGNNGRIPGYGVWAARGSVDLDGGPAAFRLSLGLKNLFDHRYFTRSFDDNNQGKYVAQPRTLYLQLSSRF